MGNSPVADLSSGLIRGGFYRAPTGESMAYRWRLQSVVTPSRFCTASVTFLGLNGLVM